MGRAFSSVAGAGACCGHIVADLTLTCSVRFFFPPAEKPLHALHVLCQLAFELFHPLPFTRFQSQKEWRNERGRQHSCVVCRLHFSVSRLRPCHLFFSRGEREWMVERPSDIFFE